MGNIVKVNGNEYAFKKVEQYGWFCNISNEKCSWCSFWSLSPNCETCMMAKKEKMKKNISLKNLYGLDNFGLF